MKLVPQAVKVIQSDEKENIAWNISPYAYPAVQNELSMGENSISTQYWVWRMTNLCRDTNSVLLR